MEIQSTAEISIETLNDMIADNHEFDVTMIPSSNYPYKKKYDVFEMLRIKREMQKFLDGCPYRDPNNPASDIEIFAYIYIKLAHMVEYDDLARDIKTKASDVFKMYSSDYVSESASLKGPMCNHYAICSGFAEALRNLLAEKGIEAKYMSGKTKPQEGSNEQKAHAWNQVKLSGLWYNCDITCDRSFIVQGLVAPNFLKSNYEFLPYSKYTVGVSPKIEVSKRSLSVESQEGLMRRYKDQILSELFPPEEKKKSFVSKILEKLHLKKSDDKVGKQYE